MSFERSGSLPLSHQQLFDAFYAREIELIENDSYSLEEQASDESGVRRERFVSWAKQYARRQFLEFEEK